MEMEKHTDQSWQEFFVPEALPETPSEEDLALANIMDWFVDSHTVMKSLTVLGIASTKSRFWAEKTVMRITAFILKNHDMAYKARRDEVHKRMAMMAMFYSLVRQFADPETVSATDAAIEAFARTSQTFDRHPQIVDWAMSGFTYPQI